MKLSFLSWKEMWRNTNTNTPLFHKTNPKHQTLYITLSEIIGLIEEIVR